MNIHLPAILGFTRYQGFDPSPHGFGGNVWNVSLMIHLALGGPMPTGFLHRLCSTFWSQSVWQSERTLRLQDLVLTTIWSSKESLNHVKSYVNPCQSYIFYWFKHWFMISIIESFWFEPQCCVRGSPTPSVPGWGTGWFFRLSSALKPSKITSSGFPAASWDSFWCSAEQCWAAGSVKFPILFNLPFLS